MLYFSQTVAPESTELPKPFQPPAWLFHEKVRLRWFLLFAALFSLQALPLVWQDSPIADEAWEVTTGYYYWLKSDVVSFNNQPPLAGALQAFPLLFAPVQVEPFFLNQKIGSVLNNNSENRAYSFYYVSNLDHLGLVTALPRLVTLLFALGTGFLLYRLVRWEEAPVFLFTLLLWAFEPTFLAFSVVGKADVPLAFFCLASFLAFRKGQEEAGLKWNILAGALAAMAVTSKLTALALAPLFLILEIIEAWQKPAFRKRLPWRWVTGLPAFAAVVFLVYLPGMICIEDHRSPFVYFYYRIRERLWLSNHTDYNSTFFLEHWRDHSLWWYPPINFFLKTTVPFSLLAVLGLALLAYRKIKVPTWVWIFPLGWMAFLEIAPSNPVRYALPAFPALILIGARAAAWLWKQGAKKPTAALRPLVVFLGLWHPVSTLAHFPNHIGYANDFITADTAWKLLNGDQLDLWQDCKRLGNEAQRRQWQHVKLAYSGQTDPFYFGLPLWEDWTVKDLQGPQPGTTYVVQRALLREGNPEEEKKFPIRESWAGQVEPSGSVGVGWVYFEVPGDWKDGDTSPVLPSTPYLVYQNAPYRKAIQP